MSIRIWEEIASQKKQVEKQREDILNAFKQRKVADEWGQVKAEKLFQPITKLLAPAGEKPEEEKDDEDLYANFYDDLLEEGDVEDEMINLFDDGQELLAPDEGVAPKYLNIPLPDDDLEEEASLEQPVLPESDEEEVLPGEKPATRWKSEPSLPSYSEVFPRRKKKRK